MATPQLQIIEDLYRAATIIKDKSSVYPDPDRLREWNDNYQLMSLIIGVPLCRSERFLFFQFESIAEVVLLRIDSMKLDLE
jgi:hypothetical protein